MTTRTLSEPGDVEAVADQLAAVPELRATTTPTVAAFRVGHGSQGNRCGDRG